MRSEPSSSLHPFPCFIFKLELGGPMGIGLRSRSTPLSVRINCWQLVDARSDTSEKSFLLFFSILLRPRPGRFEKFQKLKQPFGVSTPSTTAAVARNRLDRSQLTRYRGRSVSCKAVLGSQEKRESRGVRLWNLVEKKEKQMKTDASYKARWTGKVKGCTKARQSTFRENGWKIETLNVLSYYAGESTC